MSSQNFEINSDFDWKVSHFYCFRFLFFWFLWELSVWDHRGESIWNFGLVFFSRYEVKKCYRMEKLNRESCRIICSMAVN